MFTWYRFSHACFFVLFLHAPLLIYEYEWRLDRTWFHCRLKAFCFVFSAFSYAILQAIRFASFDNAFQIGVLQSRRHHYDSTHPKLCHHWYMLIVAICATVFPAMNLDLIPLTALFFSFIVHSIPLEAFCLYILSHSTLGVWGTILYHYHNTSLFYLYTPNQTNHT